MKDNRFKLTALIAVALLAVGVGLGYASQRLRALDGQRLGAGGSPSASNALGLDVDLLLQNVIQRWQQVDGLTADVKWEVHLFGHNLQGIGQYTQTGQGSRQRHGIVLQGGDESSPVYFQQAILASEPVVWSQWQTSVEQSASMVRLNEIAAYEKSMPRAGIAHIVWRLSQAYSFDGVKHIVQGDRQFLLVQGTKRTDWAEGSELLPFLNQDANGASLLLDAASGFPYRIQWEAVTKDRREPLVTVQLLKVRSGVSKNQQLLAPRTIVPDAKDQTESYRMAVMSGAGGRY